MADAVQDKGEGLGKIVSSLAATMLKLAPGELARLRRMDPEGPGILEFWRLATLCGIRGDSGGMQLVRILAVIAPKGDAGQRPPFHNFNASLGRALHAAGYSEARLARFLALPFETRGEALESMARLLVAKGLPPGGLNCVEIAHLLFSKDVWPARKLAENYYIATDIAEAATKKESAQ
jgi:CRISPR system Cascade subunit CasB